MEIWGHVSFYKDEEVITSSSVRIDDENATREEIKEMIRTSINNEYKNYKKLCRGKRKAYGTILIEGACKFANRMEIRIETGHGTRYLKWKIKT